MLPGSTRAREFRQFSFLCILIASYHPEVSFRHILAGYRDRNILSSRFFPCFISLPNLGSDIEIPRGFGEQDSQAIGTTAFSFVEMDGILARIPRAIILAGNIHRQYDKEALSCASL